MRRRLLVGLALALFGAAASAQTPQAEPGPRGGIGLGVQIDLGALLRAAGALLRGAPQASDAEPYVPEQLIAAWDDSDPVTAAELAAAVQANVVQDETLPALGLRLAVLQLPAGDPPQALQTLRARFPQIVVDRHSLLRAQTAGAARQYAAALVGAGQAAPPLPRAVRIGVIDGDAGAPAPALDLAGFDRQAFVAQPAGGEHAAAVLCELACAADTGFAGFARGSMLLAATVLTRSGPGAASAPSAAVVRALDWMLARAAAVVNLSLGGPPDAVLALAVQRSLQRGLTLVAAAGNGGNQAPLPYPAALPGVIAVAAVDADAKPYAAGNRGANLRIAAPGVDLWLPVGGGAYLSGTSYAAPIVTAWIAQRLARGLPADAAAVCASARDLPPPGSDPITGCGLLQWAR